MIQSRRNGRNAVFIVVGQTNGLCGPMIGEERDPLESDPGEEELRAAWLADETVISTIREAARRKMAIWISSGDEHASLAALTLSEYRDAAMAEGADGAEHAAPLLNFFHTGAKAKQAVRKPSWQDSFVKLGVIAHSSVIPSLSDALATARPRLMVGIGTGTKVANAFRLAQQQQVVALSLGFAKQSRQVRPAQQMSSAEMMEQLSRARSKLQMYRAETRNADFKRHQPDNDLQPAHFHAFPPLPLLVHWQFARALSD